VTTTDKTYPVNIRGELSSPPQRGWWLIKWLLGIPHYIILGFLMIAFVFVAFIAFWAILFTGKYPKGLFKFNTGVLRWWWRVSFYSYGALATDKYPPFSLDPDPNYPADLEIPYPEKLSKGLVLVKWWLLAIPHYIIVSVFTSGPAWQTQGWDYTVNNQVHHMGGWQASCGGLIFIVAIFAGVFVLFTGRYPKDLFKLAMGFNRWAIRVGAYASLMTDAYPPFRLWDD
jgi:hypothetical protein